MIKPLHTFNHNRGFHIAFCSGAVLFFAIFFSSCKTSQSTSYYFKTVQRDTVIGSISGKAEDLKIKKNDLLSINFSSLNRDEDIIYNAPAIALSSITGNGAYNSGYLVDASGNVQLHRLGMVYVEGMTRAELKNKLQKDIGPYLKDPVITVRYLNHKITVLGEVIKPQVISMPEEQLSILEVLGTSGDVSLNARRDNILVIRETETGKEFRRFNLENHSVFSSDWYWLRPGDVVYVEPNDKKITEENRNRRQQTLAIALSALSVVMIILNRVIK